MPAIARHFAVCTIALIAALATLGEPSRRIAAADSAAPSVDVLVTGSDELMADAHMALMLTNQQNQWPILKSYIEVFLIGVDPKLPTRVTALPSDKAQRLVWSIPVQDFNTFNKQNLQSVLTPRVRSQGDGLYKLGSGRREDFNGYLLYTPPYAVIGEDLQDVKQVAPDPRTAVKSLFDRHYTIGLEVRNKQLDAPSQAKRRELFQGTRKDALAGMKKEKGETPTEFNLRKKALDIQLDETEWFYAESDHLTAGMTIDKEKKRAQATLEITPIVDSELAKTIDLLGKKPSYFANIEKSANPILAARINHPLSATRQKSVLAMAVLIRDGMKDRTDADEKLQADQKEASRQVADKTFALFEAAIKAGLADGFVDVHPGTSGKHSVLFAFRAADGTKVEDILSQVPKAGAGTNVKLNITEESGVKIHSIEFSQQQHPHWGELLGPGTAYVGGSKDAVWFAAGEGAIDALKAAIKKTKQPAPAGAEKAPWAELVMRLKPWVNEVATQAPKRKGEGSYRKMAMSAFEPGDDQITARMTVQDRTIVGQMELQSGFLRFAGAAAADFSKNNLDTGPQKKASR